MKKLVVYFSATGVTEKVAEIIKKTVNSSIFEVTPEVPYKDSDLKWLNPLARCNKEKIGRKDVPIARNIDNMRDYGFIFLGFPIWYYGAPNVVNTFCKGYDWSGKHVYIFATSGSSGIGKTGEKLEPYLKGGQIFDAKRVSSIGELAGWVL